MKESLPVWEDLAQARHALVRAAVLGTAPPRQALAALDEWPDEFAAVPVPVPAERMAGVWGNLQLIMVECGPETALGLTANEDTSLAWQRVRRSTEQAFQALLTRPEWGALARDVKEEVLPLLVDAVLLNRQGRITRCIEAVEHFRTLSYRTSGAPHAWRIHCIVEMQYPRFTVSGWYGRMGVDFTWRCAQAVVQAILESGLVDEHTNLPLVVGYDSRVHANQVATQVTEIVTAYGVPVHLCSREAPTPALVSYMTETLGVSHNCGLLMCTASRLPVKDENTGQYLGTEYQGIRYRTPYGTAPPERQCDQISRRAAELLIEEPDLPRVDPPGEVTIINPMYEYTQHVLGSMGYPVIGVQGEEDSARDLVYRYWQQPKALIVIDDMFSAARRYLRAICAELQLKHEVMHSERNPLFGDLIAANPVPPHINDLAARVRELASERMPLIGLAVDADGDRFGVVDETGTFLPGDAVLALVTDYLLAEAYPEEPGMVMRSSTATRLVDRLVALPEYAGRAVYPAYRDHLPPYMQAPDYRQLVGNPRRLHGDGVFVASDVKRTLADEVQETLHGVLEQLLVAGDAWNGLVTHGRPPDYDGLWGTLLVLQICAVRGTPVGELWRQLQEKVGPSHIERMTLDTPEAVRLGIVNRYMQQFSKAGESQLATPAFQLDGCTVQFAGGVRDQFIEWALVDPDGAPAYLTISVSDMRPAIDIYAEAKNADIVHRIFGTVTRRVEELIMERLARAESIWQVVDTLASIQLPTSVAAELPGTLNCRIAQQAYTRLQELARPGREAPTLLQFVMDRLGEVQPEKARIIAACRFGDRKEEKRPPIPRVTWEGEEGQR